MRFTMKYKTKVICAFWVICIPSLILGETLVRSQSYKQINENAADFSFSLVNLGSVQSELQCFRHCNSDGNCCGVGIRQSTLEKALNCLVMKKESASQVTNQDLADVQVYVKGNTYKVSVACLLDFIALRENSKCGDWENLKKINMDSKCEMCLFFCSNYFYAKQILNKILIQNMI